MFGDQRYSSHTSYKFEINISSYKAKFGNKLIFAFFGDFCSIFSNVLNGHIDITYEFIVPPTSVIISINAVRYDNSGLKYHNTLHHQFHTYHLC